MFGLSVVPWAPCPVEYMRTVSIFACHNDFELAYVQRCHLNLNAYFLVRLCGDCVASSTSKIGVSLLANLSCQSITYL